MQAAQSSRNLRLLIGPRGRDTRSTNAGFGELRVPPLVDDERTALQTNEHSTVPLGLVAKRTEGLNLPLHSPVFVTQGKRKSGRSNTLGLTSLLWKLST